MIVDKPHWVSHEGARGQFAGPRLGIRQDLRERSDGHALVDAGRRIFSVDIDQTATRLCTSGEDCKAKIWNLGALIDPANESAEQQGPSRLLASLSDHTGPVNTARFSPCGQKLATGSDDKLVVLYTLRPGPGSAIFGAPWPPDQV